MMRTLKMLMLLGAVAAACNHQSCLKCSSNTECAVCNTYLNYASDYKGGCTVVYAENCQLMDDYGMCKVCAAGATPYLGTCKYITADWASCLFFDCDGSCAKCSSTTYVDSNGRCQPLPYDYWIPNCESYMGPLASLKCEACAAGYQVIGNWCYPTPQNCLVGPAYGCQCGINGFLFPVVQNASVNFWEIVTGSYTMGFDNSGGFICRYNTDPNCDVAVSVTRCQTCKPGYVPNAAGLCVVPSPAIANCYIYASATVCSECVLGYYLSNNICVANPVTTNLNCLYYSGPTTCKRCAPQFYLSNNNCVATTITITNCNFYSTANSCLYCNYPYYVSANACVLLSAAVPNCVVYNAAGCLYCAAGFYVAGGVCVATPTIANCSRYSANGVCLECSSAFYLSGNACVARIIANCRVFNPDQTCLYCVRGYYLNGGACLAVSTIINGCDIYSGPASCFRCVYNRDLINNVCTLVPPDNCQVYTSPTQCVACIPNYYYDAAANDCLASNTITNCYRFSTISTCAFCNGNYYLSGNQCIITTSPVNNCVSHTAEGLCGRCKVGFYPSAARDICIPVAQANNIANCVLYTGDGICGECSAATYLTGTGTCVFVRSVITGCETYVNGVCVKCLGDNFFIAPFCASTTVIPNCYIYSSRTTCAFCNIGFIISNNACLPFNAGSVANCLVYTSASTCQFCNTGFYLASATSCLPVTTTVANCVRYASATTCAQCSSSTFLATPTLCAAFGLVANCKFATAPNVCFICNSGFYLSNGACVSTAVLTNCIEYTAPNVCLTCATNFYPSGASCLPIPRGIANCLVYSNASTCQTCINGYYLYQNVCYKGNLDGCLVYNGPNACLTCAANFALSPRGFCVANCFEADTVCTSCSVCMYCRPGYYPDMMKVCQPVVTPLANCLYYASATRCAVCQTDYFLLMNGTCIKATTQGCTLVTSMPEVCSTCDAGFYPNPADGMCIPVPAKITGCSYYDQITPSRCDVCSVDYYQIALNGACREVPAVVKQVLPCHLKSYIAPKPITPAP